MVDGVSLKGRPTTVGISADGGTSPTASPTPGTTSATGMKGYGSYGDKYYAFDGKGNGANNTATDGGQQ